MYVRAVRRTTRTSSLQPVLGASDVGTIQAAVRRVFSSTGDESDDREKVVRDMVESLEVPL
jgi:hypothetical protein